VSRPTDLTPAQERAEARLTTLLGLLQSAIVKAEAAGLYVEFNTRTLRTHTEVSLALVRRTCSNCSH